MEIVNKMAEEKFVETFGNVVEHCSLAGAAICIKRPFVNTETLHRELCKFLDELPTLGKEGVLRLHPDLAGRLAELQQLTQESAEEQRAARLNTLTDAERKELGQMNRRYKEKFGIPFVICARENKKEAIMRGIKSRLNNDKETEIYTGIEEVKKIMYYRIQEVISKLG